MSAANGTGQPVPVARRKGPTSVSSRDYDRMYETVQGLVKQATDTTANVAALTEVMKSHDERLSRIESGGNVAVLNESLKALEGRVTRVEGGPARWVTWVGLGLSAFSTSLVFVGMIVGALIWLITHAGG